MAQVYDVQYFSAHLFSSFHMFSGVFFQGRTHGKLDKFCSMHMLILLGEILSELDCCDLRLIHSEKNPLIYIKNLHYLF